MAVVRYRARRLFDGEGFVDGVLTIEEGRVAGLGPASGPAVDLGEGTLAPGLVDLQVNGSGGIAVNGEITAAGLAAICATQLRLGTTACLPTLITDRPEATRNVITAAMAAAKSGAAGFLGLHLEGPHLDPRRKGAHAAELIRPMAAQDLAMLLEAAAALPCLMVTLAPEAVTLEQIRALAQAGVIVSLGHTDCSAAAARAAIAAGASCVIHLFNAMSQLTSREPGLVGAALAMPVFAGLIADGIHVDPLTMRVALAAKPRGMFLVSDCMEVQGTEEKAFFLGGRRILRAQGRLTLEDGTLAGADLTLPTALRVLVEEVGIAPAAALAMASSMPADVMGVRHAGRLQIGAPADFILLDEGWKVRGVWKGGRPVAEVSDPLRG